VRSHLLPSFWKCYKRLPKRIQELADKNFVLFKGKFAAFFSRAPAKVGVYTAQMATAIGALAWERRGGYYWLWIGTHEITTNSSCGGSHSHAYSIRGHAADGRDAKAVQFVFGKAVISLF
jgi:hypothetical protein